MTPIPLSGGRASVFYRRQLAHQRHINRALQHAIQPAIGVVSEIEGMRVAVRCRSADPALRVGGDWYLVLPLPNGDLVLAVGDVVGHGLDAVESMVGLRYAMAAYAAEGDPPAMILSRLNNLLCRSGGATTASAVVAKYRPSMGRLVWARAGHPPLLLSGRRRVMPLPNPRGPLLGLCAAEPPFAQESRQLLAGESVLLYTDGMTPRGTFDDGIGRLAARITGVGDPTAILNVLDFAAAAATTRVPWWRSAFHEQSDGASQFRGRHAGGLQLLRLGRSATASQQR